MTLPVYAVDFETFYDAEYGIEEVGLWHYLNDKRFDAYMVAIHGPGISWVGHPKDAPWDKIAGTIWISHNYAFDQQVYWRLCELGIVLGYRPMVWYCTANMSVSLGGPRSLKEAAKHFLGRELDKGMRGYMKGKNFADIPSDKAELLEAYALSDSVNCYDLWMLLEKQWPQIERDTAELNFQQTLRGIGVNKKMLEDALPGVYNIREKALKLIPWRNDVDEKGEPIAPLSPIALKAWCVKQGIPAPVTTNAKDERFKEWQKGHGDVDVVKAMQTYRSANAMFTKGNTLFQRVRPDGRYQFEMKYFGATTGRWSGGYGDDEESAKFNPQNLTKETMFGLNLRHCLIPAPGKKFVIADYSQIEPRSLAWLVSDKKLMNSLRSGMGLYEAYARAHMGWTGGVLKKEDANKYAAAKAAVLACGYQCGWAKLKTTAGIFGVEEALNAPIENYTKNLNAFMRYCTRYAQLDKIPKDATEQDLIQCVNAWLIVTEFRASNRLITDLWKQVESDCRKCVGTNYEVELPSGRMLRYFNVQVVHGKLMVQKKLEDAHINVWGGFLVENITQATARDVLRDAMLKLERHNIQTVMSVHDEIICEVDRDVDNVIIRDLMIEAPSWMEGIPLDVSIEDADFYKK